MPCKADDYLSRHFQTSGTDLARKVDELAAPAAPGDSPNLALYREMLFTVTRMAQADRNRWDAKIMLQTLREMEHAFSVSSSSSGDARSPCSARRARQSNIRSIPWRASWRGLALTT